MSFLQSGYAFAERALRDGGFNSKTYEKFCYRGHLLGFSGLLNAQSQRMKTLHLLYAEGQREVGWVAIDNLYYRSLAVEGTLQEDYNLPFSLRESPVFWSYWLSYSLPMGNVYPNQPIKIYYSPEDLSAFEVNEDLKSYVFNGLKQHFVSYVDPED